MTDVTPTENFVGLGGRAAFNVHPSIQLEAEMGYDFKRSFAQTFTNGVSTELVTSHVRRLHGVLWTEVSNRIGTLPRLCHG